MKKLRLLAWIITLTMLCELLPLGTFAQSDIGKSLAQSVAQSFEEENGEAVATGECGDDLTWSLSSDGTLTISGTGDMYDYISDGISANTPWAKFLIDIKKVEVRGSIGHIGKLAFSNCSNLRSIGLPEAISSIGEQAFSYCSSLISISIPSSVTSIDYQTFLGCSSLTTIILPDSLEFIGNYAFDSCSSLGSIILPESVVSIGRGAFTNCSSLTSVFLPSNISSIEYAAFSSCSSLKNVYYAGPKARWNSISISEGNEVLLNAAIYYQSSYSDIGISFSGVCGENLTWNLSSDGTLTISGTGDMYDYSSDGIGGIPAPPWISHADSISKILIDEGVTSIGSHAFVWCKNVDYFYLPNGLISIEPFAFYGCSSDVSIVLPDTMSRIGSCAFQHFTGLTSIDIPDSITEIGDDAFSGCYKLLSFNMPDSVTAIGMSSFSGCNNLSTLTLSNQLTFIPASAFEFCRSLVSVTLPSGVSEIDYNAFDGCTSLSSISFSDAVVHVRDYAFNSCDNLTDVYYGGTPEQWNRINPKGAYNLALWYYATIHYQSTAPTDTKTFTFGRDNLSFLNKSSDFFNLGQSLQHIVSKVSSIGVGSLHSPLLSDSCIYQISDSKFNQLVNNLAPSTRQYIMNQRLNVWGGSCFGMMTISLLHYIMPDRLPLSSFDGAQNPYDLSKPKSSSEVMDLVNYYQLSQFLPSFQKNKFQFRYNVALYYDSMLSDLIDELNNHHPLSVGLSCSSGGHRVLFLEIDSVEDDSYKIRIYDPNYNSTRLLTLYKATDSDPARLHVSYKSGDYTFTSITSYVKSSDIYALDARNYFKIDDYEPLDSFDTASAFITAKYNTDVSFNLSETPYFQFKDGVIYSSDPNVFAILSSYEDEASGNYDIVFPSSIATGDLNLKLSSPSGIVDTDFILNDTLLSLSTSGPVSLTYNEEARTVDVTAETPTDVNVLMTQNNTTTEWPWNSWAIDTTGTTEFHAELKDDGLHLSGDGIANAQYATENADTDIVDNGTIPAKATDVTIVKKDGNNQQTEIKDNTQTKPTDPDKLTVTVVDGKITAIDDVPIADDTTVLDNVAAETKITITADDKSADGKTFREWVVTPADSVTLSDASSSTASFTMGAVSVTIKAQYDSTTPTPTPTPGGGGGDGGGAAVILGLGAAAAITAGIVLTMPVDVQGRVELADHAAVPGAKVSLLKNGNVVTQTTADESGHFSLKAKRGDYELAVVYTDANGQFVQKTTRIKAPAKDFVVTF